MLFLKQLSLATAIAATTLMSAQANTVVAPSNHQVTWTKSASSDLNKLALTDRTAAVVFIRPSANNAKAAESSTNILLNGRFLTSLQDGHYSAGVVCAGDIRLNAVPTAAKVNNAPDSATKLNLKAGETQYFLVTTESGFTPVLQELTAEQAAQTLKASNTYKQNHQISRIDISNCPVAKKPTPIAVVTPVISVAPVISVPAPEYYVETRPNVRLDILFDFDKSDIKPRYQGEVKKAADFLMQYPDAMVIVEGHTDSKGSEKYNQKLSERRAASVRNALIAQHGINPARITAVGFGELRPIGPNDTEEQRQANRRVMVVIPNE